MKGLPAIALLAVLTMVLVSLPSVVAEDGSDGPLPQEQYPEADIIISETDDGRVLVTIRSESSGEVTYSTRTYRSGADIVLTDWSDVDGSVSIVMDGGTVGDLTLVRLDAIRDPESPIDVDFRMVAGSVSSLTAVSATGSVSSSLPDSHFTAYCPVEDLSIDIRGDVEEMSAADCMVRINTISISVGVGGSVDRLYPAGDAARCTELSVTVAGGSVGYMSNRCTVVSYLDYDLTSGSIDYLCIGADTEGGVNRYLESKWTFYVQRDVIVSVGSMMTVGNAIIGGGILEAPSVLCNGESPSVTVSRNVEILAHDVDLTASRCFLTDDGKALNLSGYEIGGTLSRASLSTTYITGWTEHPTYGNGGLWDSASDLTVLAGTVLYLDTNLIVEDGMSVESGGRVVNGNFVILSGTISVEGTFENNGVVERRDNATVEGEMTGRGIVATCIYARPNDGRIDVMTVTDDAVVLRSQSGEMYFNSAMVRLADSGATVRISAPESMYIGGSLFVVSLHETDVDDGHRSTWSLYIAGLEDSDESVTVMVSIPANVPSGYVAKVTDSSGNEMEVETSDGSSGTVTFVATGNGAYHLDIVQEDGGTDGLDPLVINVAIALAIVVVASFAVYLLLRR